MNRPQFLAELNQYLTFFTPDERTALMAVYTRRFDAAGGDGEGGVLVELGTPMRVAIDLKRRQEAGDSFEEIFASVTGTEFAEAPNYSVETEVSGACGEESGEVTDEGEASAVPADTAAETEAQNAADAALENAEPVSTVAPKSTPRKKSVVGIIGAAILSIILAAFFLCVAAVGALCITAAGYFIMAGLKTLLTLTDALYLFAGGLVLGGVGVLVIWFAIWAAISLIKKLFAVPAKPREGGVDYVAGCCEEPAEQTSRERDTK